MRTRLTFSKTGALRFTGHLDLHKIWERSFRRAGLPLAYSQGFHPQPRLQLAAALPLGFEARAELLDFWTTEPIDVRTLPAALSGCTPPGLRVLEASEVQARAPALQTLVTAAEYRVCLRAPVGLEDLRARVAGVLDASALPRERRGKAYDLRPLIEDLRATGERELHMRLAARAGATGRPEEVLEALDLPRNEALIERTRLRLDPS